MSTLLIMFGISVFAADNFTPGGMWLTTSPTSMSISLEPGSQATFPLKVRNNSDRTEHIAVKVYPFAADKKTGHPILLDSSAQTSYVDWVSLSENDFELAPNEWKTIQATFSVPKEAAFSYFYAITFLKTPEKPIQDGKVEITSAAAVMTLLEVKSPNAVRNLEVTDFSTSRSLFEFLPVTFNVNLHNTGNVHLSPRGNIFISRGNQKDVAVLSVNSEAGNVLPDSPRQFTASWEDGFPVYKDKIENDKIALDKNGKQIKTLKWDFSQANKLRFGKYTAMLLLAYDNGERDVPVQAVITFWVLPWRILLVVLVLAIFIFAGVFVVFRGILKAFRRRKYPPSAGGVMMLLLAFAIFPLMSKAADKSSIELSPAMTEVVFEPNQKEAKAEIVIKNKTDKEQNLSFSVLDLDSANQGLGPELYGKSLSDLSRDYGSSGWVTVSPKEATISAGNSLKIDLVLTNKSELGPGSHYAAVIAKTNNILGEESGSSPAELNFTPSLSSLIFLNKKGGEVYGLELSDTKYKSSLWSLPDKISLNFKNTGNVYIVPRGYVSIYDPKGRLVSKGVINEESLFLLPQGERKYDVDIKAVKSAFWPGPYSLEVNYRYDGKEQFNKQTSGLLHVGFYGLSAIFLTAGIVFLLINLRSKIKIIK